MTADLARESFANEGLTARACAIELLHAILVNKKSFDVLLETDNIFKALDPRDKSFVHMLVATTLRRLGQVDDLIEKLQARPDSNRPPHLQNILRIGIVQILFMAVADHAAVDTSVRLCEERDMTRFKSFVNAMLRRLIREQKELLAKQDPVRLNIPKWLLSTWIEDWGLTRAGEIAEASLNEAPLDITLKTTGMMDVWATTLDAKPMWYSSVRLKEPKPVAKLPGYEEGLWWVQDCAAALPAHLFHDIDGKTVADLCAAPGGKTAQLASRGAKVIALDRSAKRLARLEENMQRLNFKEQVRVEVADAAHWSSKDPVDAILIDAPCSATGVIRRHPDVPHLKDTRDIEKLVETQWRILAQAAYILPSGGTMIYCTCSTLKAEGEHQIERFLEEYPDFKRDPITAKELDGREELLTKEGDVRIFPDSMPKQGGLDGFFISRLVKK